MADGFGAMECAAPASALDSMKGMLSDLRRKSHLWKQSLAVQQEESAALEANIARNEALIASFEEAIAKLEQPNG